MIPQSPLSQGGAIPPELIPVDYNHVLSGNIPVAFYEMAEVSLPGTRDYVVGLLSRGFKLVLLFPGSDLRELVSGFVSANPSVSQFHDSVYYVPVFEVDLKSVLSIYVGFAQSRGIQTYPQGLQATLPVKNPPTRNFFQFRPLAP